VAGPTGWLVAGAFLPKDRIDRDVMGWRSADGKTWERVPAVAPTPDYEELQRVAVAGGTPVAAGVRGASFGVWRLGAGGWEPVGAFGTVRPGGTSGVRSLIALGDHLYGTTSDGESYALWTSADGGASWRPVEMPARVKAVTETSVAVSGDKSRLLLVSDDSATGRIYLADTAD
jgi:hypothetical protein